MAVPAIFSVHINNHGVEAIAGESYTLTCGFSGYERHTWNDGPLIIIKWIKNNGTQTQLNTDSSRLHFSSLSLSDAGEYVCTIDVYDGTVLLSSGSRSTSIYLTCEVIQNQLHALHIATCTTHCYWHNLSHINIFSSTNRRSFGY